MPLRVVLVQLPLAMYDRADLAPPLGLLTLAGTAKREGAEVTLLDFNLEQLLGEIPGNEDFYRVAAERISSLAPDIVGFTSMGVESHVGIELARLIKDRLPKVQCVLGGAHYSSIAKELLAAFPWVDSVVRGAGEREFGKLLSSHRQSNTLREPASDTRTPSLSTPNYSLLEPARYFSVNPRRLALCEQGRGCVFNCSFCYSRGHWADVTSRDVESVFEELERVSRLGFKHVFFVQDNFLNSPRKAREFAEALAAKGLPLTWQGYSTLPQLQPETVSVLGSSGCRELFVGVDAVTDESMGRFNKPLFQGAEDLYWKIEECARAGIQLTCAFLVEGPFEGDLEHLKKTLAVALGARLAGASIRLNLLTGYPGTELAKFRPALRYSELKPRLLLDCPPVVWENAFARTRPELFPFHSTALSPTAEHRAVSITHAAFTLINHFPEELEQLCGNSGDKLFRILEEVSAEVADLNLLPPKLRRVEQARVFNGGFPEDTLAA